MEFITIRKHILESVHECEICGRRFNLEVHHKIPRVKGGTDDRDNLIVLCDCCHKEEHKQNRRTLQAIGIAKRQYGEEPIIKLGMRSFYLNLYERYGNYYNLDDVLEYINELFNNSSDYQTIDDPVICSKISCYRKLLYDEKPNENLMRYIGWESDK